jgi:hypothetical protein
LERTLRARAQQASQVVVGEAVSPRGVGYLRQAAHRVVVVADRRRIRIALAGEAIERVIAIVDRLPLAVRRESRLFMAS